MTTASSSEQTPFTIPLSQLPAGQCGQLQRSVVEDEDAELLRAMGLNETCVLRMCRAGEPCIIEVNATRLGLSTAMTRNIFVCPVAASGQVNAGDANTPD